jgi:hypothetical protein
MSFPCKHGCGTWLHTDPDVRSKTGKLIPLQENNLKHDCHLSPYYKSKNQGVQKAIAIKKQAIQKLDEYQQVKDAEGYIAHLNSRLGSYELELIVKEKEL